MTIETSEQWRERIDSHREAQTCSICLKHLEYSEGVYTITHSHWGCHERSLKELDDALAKWAPKDVGPDRKPGTRNLRGNGGHLIHAVDNLTMVALCGYKPKNSNTWRMKERGYWRDHDYPTVTCGYCVARLPVVE